MKRRGLASIGVGSGIGADKGINAILRAFEYPLLKNTPIRSAKSILINFTSRPGLSLNEVQDAAKLVYDRVSDDTLVVYGIVTDKKYADTVRTIVITAGFAAQCKHFG